MKALLHKELRLSALLLTYLFIGFGAMTLIPGYPILCGAFFITLGIFQSFQSAREANDIVYSALLPIAKRDVVRGKYLFVAVIELCGFTLMTVFTLVRMTVLADAPVYRQNALMNANPFFLGMVLLIWGLIDFDGLFTAFHRIAFTNDGWLLDPRTDLLIRLMPTELFVRLAVRILLWVTAAAAAAGIGAKMLLKRIQDHGL